jgi:hypothetical protein
LLKYFDSSVERIIDAGRAAREGYGVREIIPGQKVGFEEVGPQGAQNSETLF